MSKETATTKKTLVPEIRFEGFSGEWRKTHLNKITQEIGTGKSHYLISSRKGKDMFPVLGSRGIIGYDSNYDYEGNYLLTARVGENAGSLYKFQGKAKITDNTVFIRGENLTFLENLLNYKDLKKLSFGSGQPLIKASELNNLTLFVTDIFEQKAIGVVLETITNNQVLKQKELTKLKNFKQAMLQKLFPKEGEKEPEMRFEGFEGEWEESTLGAQGNTFAGLSGKTKEDFGHGDALYIPYTNVFNNAITDIKQLESTEVDAQQNEVKYGDVLFTTSSETPEEVGMSSVWMHKKSSVYLNSFCFGYRPLGTINLKFLAYMLRSTYVRKQFQLLAQGISRYNISKNKAMNIVIFLPVLSEQKQIGDYFYNLDQNIKSKQAELKKLKQFKQAMLSKLFV